jgi:hypothetical protein
MSSITPDTAPLSEDDQRFMARHGVRVWAEGVVDLSGKLTHDTTMMRASRYSDAWIHAFERDRHFFVIAAGQLVDHLDWALPLKAISEDAALFIDRFRNDIRDMRNMNEHRIDYFAGKGRSQRRFVHLGDDFTSDATGTFQTLIGGRLDWTELGRATMQFIQDFHHEMIR